MAVTMCRTALSERNCVKSIVLAQFFLSLSSLFRLHLLSGPKWYPFNVLNVNVRCRQGTRAARGINTQLSTANGRRSTLNKFEQKTNIKIEWANQMKTSIKWVARHAGRQDWCGKSENEKMSGTHTYKTQERDECLQEEKLYCFFYKRHPAQHSALKWLKWIGFRTPIQMPASSTCCYIAVESNARLRNHIIMYFNNDFFSSFLRFPQEVFLPFRSFVSIVRRHSVCSSANYISSFFPFFFDGWVHCLWFYLLFHFHFVYIRHLTCTSIDVVSWCPRSVPCIKSSHSSP